MPKYFNKILSKFKASSDETEPSFNAIPKSFSEETQERDDQNLAIVVDFTNKLKVPINSIEQINSLSDDFSKIKQLDSLDYNNLSNLISSLQLKQKTVQLKLKNIDEKIGTIEAENENYLTIKKMLNLCNECKENSYIFSILTYESFINSQLLQDASSTLELLEFIMCYKTYLKLPDNLLETLALLFSKLQPLSTQMNTLNEQCTALVETEAKLSTDIENFSNMLTKLKNKSTLYYRQTSLSKKKELLSSRRQKCIDTENSLNEDISKISNEIYPLLKQIRSFSELVYPYLLEWSSSFPQPTASIEHLIQSKLLIEKFIDVLTEWENAFGN